MKVVTYKTFSSLEEAKALIGLLNSNKIKHVVENIAPTVDITFSANMDLEDKVAIKVLQSDFQTIDKIYDKLASEDLVSVENDHYLYEFSDSELLDILRHYDEWSSLDFQLASKILKERGHSIDKEDLLRFKNQRIDNLKAPEKGNKGWLTFGFISAILGGLLGIFIGYHHYKFKKRIPNGERVFAYDDQARKSGYNMFILGLVAFGFWNILWIILTIK